MKTIVLIITSAIIIIALIINVELELLTPKIKG